MGASLLAVLFTCALVPEAALPGSPPRADPGANRATLGLAEAVAEAQAHQPQLLGARATTEGMRARADQLRAPLLPQLNATLSYQRTTANFVARPGSVPTQFMNASREPSIESFDFFSGGLTLSQYIWDFGQTTGRWRAAQASAEAQAQSERSLELSIAAAVRTAYFTARAQKALVQVARDNLANQERHFTQVQGFVQAGTRPSIDLLQARADRANARVQLIAAENNYAIAKAQLNQAMGVERDTDYEVQDEALPAVPGEGQGAAALTDEAMAQRPDVQGLVRQLRAQELLLSASKGGYGPSLLASASATEAGTSLTALTWNLSASLTLNWGLFQGLLTLSQVREARANVAAIKAQQATLRNQIRLEIDQARLQVRSARETLAAAGEVVASARERLRLAEARYQTGVGSIIELGDAQLAAASAEAQSVQAEYSLASARVALLRALGHGF
ncbi:MAG: TolC family protein [Polyangia bacterium]